jgi:hypothetical protein
MESRVYMLAWQVSKGQSNLLAWTVKCYARLNLTLSTTWML